MTRSVAEEITFEFFQALKEKGRNCIELAEKINRMLKVEDEYQRSMFEGMKAITAHMQKGGKVRYSELPLEAGANVIFKDLLKKYQVPYVSVISGESKKENVFYRDKDTKIVAMCRLEMFNLLNFMSEELSPKDFFKKYSNDEIKGINGLDKGDIEFIRREIAERNEKHAGIDFSVVKDLKNDGKEMIIFPESMSAEIEKAVDRVMFDFSGKDGKENKERVLKCIEDMRKFENIVKNNVKAGKTVCLVDRKRPNVLCVINENGITLHNLTKETREDQSGKEEKYIKDDAISHKDIGRITQFTSMMIEPVLMSLKEVNLIKNIKDNGEIVTDVEKFDDDIALLRKKARILPEQRLYKANIEIDHIRKPVNKEIKTIINLPEDVIKDLNKLISEKGLKETVIEGNEISSSETDYAVIEKYVSENLYRKGENPEDLSLAPLKEFEYRFFHEGRGAINLTDKKRMQEENQYIVDANDESILYRLDGKALTIFDKNEEVKKIEMESDDYIDSFIDVINGLEDPVFLKKEDLYGKKNTEILEIIKDKRPDIMDFNSKNTLIGMMHRRYSKEYEELLDGKSQNLSEKQKEAIDKIKTYKNNRVIVKYSDETKDMYREPDKKITVEVGKQAISI